MAKVFQINELNKALSVYNATNIIAFPTDTVYGIGANIFNEEAIAKIYQTKHRPTNKPLAVLCANKQQILQVAKEIPFDAEKLIDHFLPGALTVILPKNEKVPSFVTSGLNTIGIRIPNDKIALEILNNVGPLATTSANLSGEVSLNNGEDVIKLFGDEVDIIINGGNTKIGVPSTVVEIINNEVKVIREGVITRQQIEQLLHK